MTRPKAKPGETVREYIERTGPLDDEWLASLDPLCRSGRLDEIRDRLPAAAARFTELIVDNPAQFGLLIAGTIVVTRAAVNIVRPRTPLEAFALMVVLQIGLPLLATKALERGWLQLQVRDEDGQLVPLQIWDAGADRADPAR